MTTITQTITALPTAPNPNTPSTFNTLAYPFTVAQAAMGSELNTMATQMNTVAGEVNTNATNAAASQVDALASKNASVAATNYKGAWSTLTGALAVPASVQHNGVLWLLLTSLANVTTSQPGVTGDWTPIDQFVIEERTSNTILGIADFGKVLKVTSGTFSQTITAAATLGNGWYVQLANYGTGVITLDPNSAELINGAATLTLPPGHCAVVSCTGTAFRAIVLALPVGDHSVVVTTGNGHGSTNTKIRRFTTTLSSAGTAITYADSAANGASFTINEAGLYAVEYSDYRAGAAYIHGVSVNSAELTTSVATITAANRLGICSMDAFTLVNGKVSVIRRFSAADIIRPHTDGAIDSTSAVYNYFSVTKIGV